MTDPVLDVQQLSKSFGAVQASDKLSFSVAPGQVHALIGPNGAGKSTAIAQIVGELPPDSGRIYFSGQDITDLPTYQRAQGGMQRSYQITSLFQGLTVEDNVAMAIQAQQGHSFSFWEAARKVSALRTPAIEALKQVGLEGKATLPVTALSHGEQRQLELAMVMAAKPTLLLLDEPMAGMGQSESRAMMEILRPLKGRISILLVEHDMDVVFSLADVVSVLDKGTVLMTGSPDEVRSDSRVRSAYLGDEG
ncbi:ABC transporter ATP-binding protein [Thalassospiraceae bacterium LMO-JJ14]|nr:ABC transporter ATP-binding protein [Thalassospiraceae bacterium LMO-JJ14]